MPEPAHGGGPSPTTGHVIVCGTNHLARRTVVELRRRGETVCLIAPDGTDTGELDVEARVVVGDQRSDRVLREAGLATASAIILAAEDDHGNLDAALAAQAMNPDARVVIRLFDGELGAHLEELIPRARVLSSSALAAPGFISAAVFGDVGERFSLGGRVLVARGTPGPGIDLDGLMPPTGDDLVPVARFHADRPVELLPESVSGTEPGTLVMEVTAPGLDDLDELRRMAATEPPSAMERVRSLPAGLAARITAPEQRLLKFATVLVALAVISALFFALTAGLTPLDAISYAITLLTGASLLTDIDPATASAALKVYAIFLSLVGAALVAVVYAFITDAIIRSRLLQTLGRRSVPASISGHVIVCGLGTIGYRVARGVAELGVPVVVIEPVEDGRFVAAARSVGIPVVIGDARQRELLASLGVDRARALVAATSEDLVNLSAAFNARAIRSDLRVVLRLFDPDFAVRVQRAFGIRFTRSVSHLAAPAFAAAAIGSEVIATVPIGDRRLALFARLRVPAGSALEGRRVVELHEPGRLRVLAVADPGSEVARWYPDPEAEVLDPDEEVIVVATRDGLATLLEQAQERRDGA
jgi:Trk K+ transport system NAD-binding subunit